MNPALVALVAVVAVLAAVLAAAAVTEKDLSLNLSVWHRVLQLELSKKGRSGQNEQLGENAKVEIVQTAAEGFCRGAVVMEGWAPEEPRAISQPLQPEP